MHDLYFGAEQTSESERETQGMLRVLREVHGNEDASYLPELGSGRSSPTLSTGHGAWRKTRSTTLPKSARSKPRRPWVPITIKSLARALASSTITLEGGPPCGGLAVTVTPARRSSSTARSTCSRELVSAACSTVAAVAGETRTTSGAVRETRLPDVDELHRRGELTSQANALADGHLRTLREVGRK